jgi:DNA-binding GntR family transcriptional regulator
MRGNLAERIAQQLEDDLQEYTSLYLPTIRDMSEHYNVSLKTMHSAVQLLKKRNIISGCRGRRMELLKNKPERPLPERQSSDDRLLYYLRKRIQNGIYPVGHSLPKISFLMSELGVSDRTVSKAYSILERENLVYRKGRSWIVGYPQKSLTVEILRSPPVIILLLAQEHGWQIINQAARNGKFCKSFEREAEAHGLQIYPVFHNETKILPEVFPAGEAQLRKTIRRFDHRYMGTLIVGSHREINVLDTVIDELLSTSKPVVWFDRFNEKNVHSHPAKMFTRCTFPENEEIVRAVSFLKEMGHSHIALPLVWKERSGWRKRRAESIEREADRQGLHIYRIENPLCYGNKPIPQEELEKSCQALNEHGNLTMKKLLQRYSGENSYDIVRNIFLPEGKLPLFPTNDFLHLFSLDISSTLSALEQEDYTQSAIFFNVMLARSKGYDRITAILAPCDFDAYHIYFWLKSAGFSVPKDFSLLSFENIFTPKPFPLPITSVDYGSDQLGYGAFHSIFRDIALRKEKDGTIYSQPRVVRRGSVAFLNEKKQ